MPLWSYLDFDSLSSARDSIHKLSLILRVRRHTLVSRGKLDSLYRLVRAADRLGVRGALVECGVYKGGSAALMACATGLDRPVYLFDSFRGLPPPGPNDGRLAGERFRDGWCAADRADVLALFSRLGVARSRIHVVEGWFQDTLPAADVGRIAVLHVDADWYDSVRLCLEALYDRVEPGGFVVLDDYGRWEGCTRAADEFIVSRGLAPGLLQGRHYFQKPFSDT